MTLSWRDIIENLGLENASCGSSIERNVSKLGAIQFSLSTNIAKNVQKSTYLCRNTNLESKMEEAKK